MQMLLGSILSNIPGLLLLVFMLREAKKEAVPSKVLLLLVVTGCLLMLPIVALQTVIGYAGEIPFIKAHPLLSEAVLFAIRLAFVEELCKFLGAKLVTWRGAYFTNSYQGMLFPTIVALSFGILETVLYMALSLQQFQGQFWLIVLLRAFIGAPGHGAYGVLMGIFYGRAKYAKFHDNRAECSKNLWLAVLVPGCIHGLYDWFTGSQIIKIGDTSIVPAIMIVLDALVIVYAYTALYRSRGQRQALTETAV